MRAGIAVVAAIGVVAGLGPATASGAARCSAKGAQVLARSGTALLLARPYGNDDLYGPGTLVTTCRKGRRPVVLLRAEPGVALTFSHGAFAPGYVAFARSSTSSMCTKYLGDDPQCRSAGVTSYNRRTGKLRASGEGRADVLVVTPAGWLAWLSPADASGSRTLQAVDSAGSRVLAGGAIDPASVRASGATVTWTLAGVGASATLS